MNFNLITNNINKDLAKFENILQEIIESTKPPVYDALNHLFASKGKRIRPILIYLTNHLFSNTNQSTHNAAVIIELMHTATLLHDDVIDKATIRRGIDTVNNKWDNKTAILTGDYLFARATKIATDNKEYKLFDIITPAIMDLSVGELQQLKNSKDFYINSDLYFEVIQNKTASLISACCESGALTGGANEKQMRLMKEFGKILGIIFQIKDDILDYSDSKKIGKQKGIDILENKITLPVICMWENLNPTKQNEFKELWLTENKNQDLINTISELVISNNGIADSYIIIEKYKEKALEILKEIPDSKTKKTVVNLIDYIIKRDK